MKTNRPVHHLFTGILMAATICISIFSFCGWLLAWCLDGSNLHGLFVLTGLLLLAVFTLMKQIWRTRAATKDLLSIAQADLPKHVQALLIHQNINPKQVILVQSSEPTAFCFGFLKPQICLSTGLVALLSHKQLQAVLLHEDYHRRRLDPLRILLLNTLCSSFFFLPFVREWRRLIEIKFELDADRYAVQHIGKGALAGALYQILSSSSHPPSVSNKGMVAAGLSANRVRVAALLGNRSAPEPISLKSIISTTVILWLLCFILMM